MLWIGTLWAQQTGVPREVTPSNGLNTGAISVINSGEIKLDSSSRVFTQASSILKNDQQEQKSELTFDYAYAPNVTLSQLKSQVAIYRLKIDAQDQSKKGFVRAGFGNYGASLLDVYYGSKANQKAAYGFGLNHLGSINGNVEQRESGFSDNKIIANGKIFLNKHMLSGDLMYQRFAFQNYGLRNLASEKLSVFPADSALINPEILKTASHLIGTNLSLTNIVKDQKLKVGIDLSPSLFSLNDSVSEWNLQTSIHPSYEIKQGKIKLPVSLQISSLNTSQVYNRSLVHLAPSFEYTSEDQRLFADVGFSVDVTNDTSLKKNVSLYPILKGSYLISQEKGIIIKGAISGGIGQHTLQAAFMRNKWLINPALQSTNDLIKINTSIEITPLENLTTKAKIDYRSVQNFDQFLNDTLTNTGLFNLRYAAELVNVFSPGLELNYGFKKGHFIQLDLVYHNYATENDIDLFYTPTLETKLGLGYKLNKKIQISSDIYYISGLVGWNATESKAEPLDAIVDINLKADYQFNEKLSAFLYANNLLNNKYSYYRYYTVNGLNILGGLTYNF